MPGMRQTLGRRSGCGAVGGERHAQKIVGDEQQDHERRRQDGLTGEHEPDRQEQDDLDLLHHHVQGVGQQPLKADPPFAHGEHDPGESRLGHDMPAAALATSVADATAIPTMCPSRCSASTNPYFSSGRTRAKTSKSSVLDALASWSCVQTLPGMPILRAIAAAVVHLAQCRDKCCGILARRVAERDQAGENPPVLAAGRRGDHTMTLRAESVDPPTRVGRQVACAGDGLEGALDHPCPVALGEEGLRHPGVRVKGYEAHNARAGKRIPPRQG
jgi:hypothetical protein